MRAKQSGDESRPVRQSHPLADAPTPFYLQRFSYVHAGQVHVFDEAGGEAGALAAPATSSKRASQGFDADGPAPKRRERELDEEIDAPAEPAPPQEPSQLGQPLLGRLPAPFAAAFAGNSQHPPLAHNNASYQPALFPHHLPHPPPNHSPLHPPQAYAAAAAVPRSLSVRVPAVSRHQTPLADAGEPAVDPEAPPPVPGELGDAVGAGGAQPTLLSPTASPRSLASPQASDLDDHGELSPTNAMSPTLATPGTAGPPSSQVFTPLPAATAAAIALDRPWLPEDPGRAGPRLAEPLPRLLTPRPPYLPSTVRLHDAAIRDQLGAITGAFGQLPPALHRYTLFNLLRHCDRSTMSALYGELEAALRFDVLGSLPPELSSMVLQHLDGPAVFAASEVCRHWYRIVDGDEAVWQTLATAEGLHPTAADVETAQVERWGYTGWASVASWPLTPPTNAFGRPANVHKAVYRRLALIHQNWMRPDVKPKRYVIQCPDREVITCLDFSDDIIIASTEGKRHLNVYNTRTGALLHQFTDHDGGVWALKRVGQDTIVTGSTDHTVRVWSLKKGRCTHVFRGHHATVRCLDVVMPITGPHPSAYNFPLILTGSRDTTMRMWRLPSEDDEEYDSKVAFVDKENPYFVAELRGHQDSVRAVSGHGDVAVSGSYDFRVRVWDLATKKCRHELVGHENKVYAAIIDPERNRCISASMDTHIIIWDLATGSQLHKLHGHTGLVGLVNLRDDTLVSAAADKTLRVWDPETGALTHSLEGHNTAILCFVHDGRRIVSGSERHLKLWDTRTGQFSRDLLTGMELIWQVSIDRRRCVAAVLRDRCSYLEVLDFDFDRTAPPEAEPRISPVE